MIKILVPCNHCRNDEIPASITFDKKNPINAIPPKRNLKLHIDNITHAILKTINPLAQDLLEVAAYVYYADCSEKRGSEVDVYAERWRREFEFVIPVSNPDIWNKSEIKDLLIETIEFLSGDKFSFTFIPPKPRPVQLFINWPDIAPPYPRASCICLFSGGIDSLIGSIYLLKQKNERPLLISHRSHPKVDSRQKTLVSLLQERNQEWQFPHLSIWINRISNRAVEMTQRTRAFLYLSIAAAVAFELKIKNIYICENGIISINLPISGQNIGTLLTRSTHPKYLKLFEELIKILFEDDISIRNPFIYLTKSQMLNMLKSWNQSELIQEAISCSYTQGRTRMQPQCGTCSQCVNRRFSVIAAGLEEHDKCEFYGKDLFKQDLDEGKERDIPINYVRSALEIDNMNDSQFFGKYSELPEVLDCLDISPDEVGQKIYDLYKNHAKEVMEVITSKYKQHLREHLSGELPKNCLISMLAHHFHLLNPIDVYAEKVGKILSQALKIDFQTEKPKSEKRVQEAVQAALKAADERLHRESPMLSFSVVQTKPDFSNIPNYNNLLFIEVKFLNSKERLTSMMREITSRITIYRDQGAFVMFVVYDTNNFIIDDELFINDLEKHDKIKVKVIR
jgi:7-cyano-7-deazaguanine synthase in queuosine biosynthesis